MYFFTNFIALESDLKKFLFCSVFKFVYRILKNFKVGSLQFGSLIWVWRDGSAVESTCCSCRRLGFQYPHSGLQPPVSPVPGHLMSLSGFCWHQAPMWCACANPWCMWCWRLNPRHALGMPGKCFTTELAPGACEILSDPCPRAGTHFSLSP